VQPPFVGDDSARALQSGIRPIQRKVSVRGSAPGRHQEAEVLRREALEIQKRAPGVERKVAR